MEVKTKTIRKYILNPPFVLMFFPAEHKTSFGWCKIKIKLSISLYEKHWLIFEITGQIYVKRSACGPKADFVVLFGCTGQTGQWSGLPAISSLLIHSSKQYFSPQSIYEVFKQDLKEVKIFLQFE